MDSLLQIINNAARPFKDFSIELNGKEIAMKTRALSANDSDQLGKVFNETFDKTLREMEDGNVDLAIIKRSIARQSKEALCRLIVRANQADYLSEASTELDDKPFTDSAVQKLAKEKQDEAYTLLMGAAEDEIIDRALQHRAFVIATIKATNTQNLHFIYLSVYKTDETPGFNSPEEIGELDQETIADIIQAVRDALRGKAADPLRSRAKKASVKRSPSRNTSVEA